MNDALPQHAATGGYRARRFRPSDVLAGLTVGLVLVPQSLAYAELAGMPPERGLYAAAIPLLVAAPLAFSPYLQTGPVAVTGLLTFGALSSMATPGSDEYVALGLMLALIVGLARLAIGFSHAGVIAYLMSQPMLMGFIPAATLLIVSSQLPTAVGAEPPSGDILEEAAWVLGHPGAWETASTLMAVGVIVLIFGGRRLHPLFPGVLVAAVMAIAFSELSDYDGAVVGTLKSSLPPVSVDLPWSDALSLLVSGLVIAVVGFAEAGSIARRFAAEDRERWDSDQEFVSQGAANVAAAFTGGFPVGGSFSRSSLSRLAGGYSRWNGAVTGVFILMAMLATGVFESLPKAILGATVIAAVIPLVTPQKILKLWRPSRPQFFIAATTFVVTLIVSPHVEQGVMVGIGLSLAVHLWRELKIDADFWEDDDGGLHVRPSGVLWFGAAQVLQDRLMTEIAERRDMHRLTVHLDALGRLDLTGALALRAVRDEAERNDIAWSVVGVTPRDERLVEHVISCEESVTA